MLKFLGILLVSQSAVCISPSSVLYQEIFAYHNETAFKAEFAHQVVDAIYYSFRQWYFTIIFCEFTYFENRILKYTETINSGYPVLLLNGCAALDRERVKPKIDKHGETAYVVTSNELSLEVNDFAISALKKTGVFKPRYAVIFVINVPIEIDQYFYYYVQRHFQLLWSKSVTNSILLIWSDKLRLYTHNPYFDHVMEITDDKDVGKLLTQQYHNLYGYVLRLSVFRKIYVSDETGPIKCDSRLAVTVMNFINATCLPLTPRDGSTVGDLLENGTATGVTADLIDGYTDLELNSRILKESYYGYIDTTYPLIQDELCFLVKKSDRESTFNITVKMVSLRLLLLFFFNVIFFTVIAIIARKVEVSVWGFKDETVSSTTMDLVKCFLKQTLDIKFKGFAFRVVIFHIIGYSLVVNCLIEGVITTAITYPRYKPDINTFKELIQNTNMTFAVHNRHHKLFIKSLGKQYYKLLRKRIEVFNDKSIKNAIDKRQFQYAILLRKSDALYISRKPTNMKHGRPLFHTVQECPIPCSIVYGLRYGSPYQQRLNYMLHHLNQAGILKHWTESDEYTLYRTLGKSIYDEKEHRALKEENLQEVFFVWMVGLFISCVTFVIEIVIYYIQTNT